MSFLNFLNNKRVYRHPFVAIDESGLMVDESVPYFPMPRNDNDDFINFRLKHFLSSETFLIDVHSDAIV